MDHVDSLRVRMPSAVSIGGVSKSELLRTLREQDIQINAAAEALFGDLRFTTREQQQRVEIAVLSVAELGFGQGATYEQLIARAVESGLFECPLETGPHLRLQYIDQPDGLDEVPSARGRAPSGSITVASPPLDDTDETPKGFYLRRVGGALWLRGYRSWSGHTWRPEDVFVFLSRPDLQMEPTRGLSVR